MKNFEVIEKIIAYHPPMDRESDTDVIKYGDGDRECSGIVVTCFASSDVIKKAAELGANLIIAHEPLFWNHSDKTDWLQSSKIFAEKKALLDSTQVTVWRDHDHIHGSGWGQDRKYIDGIFVGIMKELGWEDYLIESPLKPLVFKIPEIDAEELGLQLIKKLGLNGLRILGDRHAKVSKVFLAEHIGERDPHSQEKLLSIENDEFDAVIPFEIIDWTISAFIRDASQLGHSKVMYNIGHFNLEEIGMRNMLSYLPDVVGDIPLHFVQSGDAFDFIL